MIRDRRTISSDSGTAAYSSKHQGSADDTVSISSSAERSNACKINGLQNGASVREVADRLYQNADSAGLTRSRSDAG